MDATLSTTNENRNAQAKSREGHQKATTLPSPLQLQHRKESNPSQGHGFQSWLCVTVGLTICGWCQSTSSITSSSLPTRKAMVHAPKASFHNQGTDCQEPGLGPWPNPDHTQHLMLILWVMDHRRTDPCLCFWAVPSWAPWPPARPPATQRGFLPQAWLLGKEPGDLPGSGHCILILAANLQVAFLSNHRVQDQCILICSYSWWRPGRTHFNKLSDIEECRHHDRLSYMNMQFMQ